MFNAYKYFGNDNYDELKFSFYPALIKKFIRLKKKIKRLLTLWGNGKAKRETYLCG